jgi:hypothetical protein
MTKIIEVTFSDKSIGYSVEYQDHAVSSILRFGCLNREHAESLSSALDMVAFCLTDPGSGSCE